MARARLIATLLITTCLVATPVTPALAVQQVFDSVQNSNVVKALKEAKDQLKAALEQIKLLKDQLSFLNDISKFMNEVSDAIGEIATIDIPLPDLVQAAAQIRSDIRCLMPDGTGWGIKFSDLNLASICETSYRYKEVLFVNQKDLEGQPIEVRIEAIKTVNKRRDALLADTAVRGIAQADIQINKSEKLAKTADELQKQLKKADTVQKREHIAAQIQLLQAQAAINQNQMMAQQLKLLSIAEIKKGLPADKVADTTGVTEEDAE